MDKKLSKSLNNIFGKNFLTVQLNDVKKLLIKNRASLETGLYFIVRGVDGVLHSSSVGNH